MLLLCYIGNKPLDYTTRTLQLVIKYLLSFLFLKWKIGNKYIGNGCWYLFCIVVLKICYKIRKSRTSSTCSLFFFFLFLWLRNCDYITLVVPITNMHFKFFVFIPQKSFIFYLSFLFFFLSSLFLLSPVSMIMINHTLFLCFFTNFTGMFRTS